MACVVASVGDRLLFLIHVVVQFGLDEGIRSVTMHDLFRHNIGIRDWFLAIDTHYRACMLNHSLAI